MSEFDGDVVVVTGGASGIGRAAVRLLHSRGARVLIGDVDQAGATALAAELGEGAHAVHVDVSDSASVRHLINATVETFGGIDVLCNHAGFGIRGTVATTAEQDWDRVMAVNLRSVYLCSKYALPHLAASGDGRIVNTSSYTSMVGIADRAAYVASKGAIAALTRAMALDHVGQAIRVNAVAPGTIDTPYFSAMISAADNPEGMLTELNSRSPMGRMGRPEEIAEAIAFLASRRSSFATGTVLTVDGGTSVW
jgi:meso-butanediol dehydrogenase / (S,S)-butanediol dehydrogenase / diacetyl reductase